MGSGIPSQDIPGYMNLFKDEHLPVNRLMFKSIVLDDGNEVYD